MPERLRGSINGGTEDKSVADDKKVVKTGLKKYL